MSVVQISVLTSIITALVPIIIAVIAYANVFGKMQSQIAENTKLINEMRNDIKKHKSSCQVNHENLFSTFITRELVDEKFKQINMKLDFITINIKELKK